MEKIFKAPAFIAAAVLVVLALAVFVYWSFGSVSTDDAFIEGDVVMISAKVGAHVQKVLVKDNQAVKPGTQLVTLDARDFEVRVAMAKADLAAAQAEAAQAGEDSARYKKLGESGDVPQQQADRAVLRQRIATAKAAGAEAALRKAELELSYTKISSPSAGHVARKAVEAGSFVQPGQALMAVVPEKKWVVANFKETELERMRPGQSVAVTIDAYPGKTWKAHVDSVQRGTGARFSLFPPENAAGNYVKVVQRVPVKIVFDEALDDRYPFSVGMSAVPVVKVR
ncbi:MAG: HlyD family secretion protein [Candidatus Omnitrophota bacterium]